MSDMIRSQGSPAAYWERQLPSTTGRVAVQVVCAERLCKGGCVSLSVQNPQRILPVCILHDRVQTRETGMTRNPLEHGLVGMLTVLLLGACSEPETPLALNHATLLDSPRPLAAFQLIDQTGAAYTNARLLGQWTAMFSGFTHCPDICPMTLGQLLNAQHLSGGSSHHQTVFISVDPGRDRPALLREYLAWFDPNWTGISGSTDALAPLLESLGLAYVRVPIGSEGDYTLDHSTAVVLVDPRGRLVGYWKAPLDSQRLAEDLATLPPP